MTPSEKRLLLLFMEMYCDRLGNDGCNDFPEFEELMPDRAERNALMKFFYERNGDSENFEPDRPRQNDTVLLALMWKFEAEQ